MTSDEKSCEQAIFEIFQKDHERLKQAVLEYLKEKPIPVCKSIIVDTVTELKGAGNAYKFKRIIEELINERLVKIDCARTWVRYQYAGEQETQSREQITTIHIAPILPIGAVFKFDDSDQLYKVVEVDRNKRFTVSGKCWKCALYKESNLRKCSMFECWGEDRPDGKWVRAEKIKEDK